MIPLAIHEARILGRRGVWPAALGAHAIATSLFVTLWMPTGGVPLWQASVLQQLAAADRVLVAVLLTWLSTFVLADDDGGTRQLIDWSVITGRPPRSIVRARIAAMAGLSTIFAVVALPAFVAAAEVSAAPMSELAGQLGAALGFTVLCLGVTSIVSASVSDRVAIWCIAMAMCVPAALAIRALDTMALRSIVPALAGAALLALAPSAVRLPRANDAR